MIRCGRDRNAEALRTQSSCPSTSSAPPRFKISHTKTKQKQGRGAAAFRDRTGEVLFIDARKLGYIVDRVPRAFTDKDTEQIVSTFHAWKRGPIVSGKALAAGSRLANKREPSIVGVSKKPQNRAVSAGSAVWPRVRTCGAAQVRRLQRVRPAGFEPTTFGSGGRRAIQLCHGRGRRQSS